MGYRLPPDLSADLEWYWNDSEAAMGVRSSLGGQVAQLMRTAPAVPEAASTPGASLKRWREAGPEERKAIRRERWERADEELRLFWDTLDVSDDAHNAIETMIDSRVSERARRIHSAVTILVKGKLGPRHERVLFRVYGDPRHAIVANELDRLRGYAETPGEREALFAAASKAYRGAHEEAKAEAWAQERRRRRARLDELLRDRA